jgi:hypothetical protein
MAAHEGYKHSPRVLDGFLRKSAETWWNLSVLFKVGVFVVGTLAILLTSFSQSAPFIIAGLTAIAELCQWRSGAIRDTWEALHRELDANDSFDWPIPKAELADLLTQSSRQLRERLSSELEEPYFASKQPPGPRRGIENMQESAWWAKHLARRAGNFHATLIVVLIAGSIVALIVSIETIRSLDVLSSIGRVVTSALMLIFSVDLIRTARSYYKYSRKAAIIVERAERLLEEDTADMISAITLMQDYHLAHAEAPMNPGWMWKRARLVLNEMWQTYLQHAA